MVDHPLPEYNSRSCDRLFHSPLFQGQSQPHTDSSYSGEHPSQTQQQNSSQYLRFFSVSRVARVVGDRTLVTKVVRQNLQKNFDKLLFLVIDKQIAGKMRGTTDLKENHCEQKQQLSTSTDPYSGVSTNH